MQRIREVSEGKRSLQLHAAEEKRKKGTSSLVEESKKKSKQARRGASEREAQGIRRWTLPPSLPLPLQLQLQLQIDSVVWLD